MGARGGPVQAGVQCARHGSRRPPDIGAGTADKLADFALVMKRLGQTMDRIGWDKRLRDLTATDVTALIEEVLEGYGAEMSRIAATAEVPF